MFTLKLYQNGPLPPNGRTVILETVGLWIDECGYGVKHIRAFHKEVGIDDEGGTPEFYVGGDVDALRREISRKDPAQRPGAFIEVDGPAMPAAPAGGVCGIIESGNFKAPNGAEPLHLESGVDGNYFSWGVLENALGKTTEVFR